MSTRAVARGLIWTCVVVLAIANIVMVVVWWKLLGAGAPAGDWIVYQEGARRILNGEEVYGELVRRGGAWTYSPLAAPLFAILAPLGVEGWRVLHIAAALAFPTRLMSALVLLSWPFWFDLVSGNVLTFVALIAAWALRGSRVASLAFLALTLLVPRPFMFPMAIWLLWRDRWMVVPFGIAAVVQLAGIYAWGYLGPWFDGLQFAARDVHSPYNLSPSQFVGGWWLVASVPFGVWLWLRGRPLIAGLAVQPYLLPYYLLMTVGELREHSPHRSMAKRLPDAELPASKGFGHPIQR